KADADRHEDVRRMFEESRRANDEMKKTAAAIVRMVTRVHSRLVRIETKIDPDAPAADLTGEHESVQ
ncbi:MAG TPA: hypothetical protein VLT45_18950, partial [Kofleriaceae bacterium]|nr:hypothetical protein [Kofleriaceae bacterium]